jgi:hypothetical protein
LVRNNKVKDIDSSFIEYSIFGLFTIDLHNYIYIKAILAKEFHIQPSELDKMPAWEYELFMHEINKAIKEENKRNQEEEDKFNVRDMRKMAEEKNFNKMRNDAMKNIPSYPKSSNYSIPSTSIPSFPSMNNL